MNRHRDDRSHRPPEPWFPSDYDPDRRRNRSATLPAHSYDPKSYSSHDARYNDPRLAPRSHRQDPPAAPPSKSHPHATRASAHHHYPQPSSYQPSHPPPPMYQVPNSSRKQPTEPPETRPSKRQPQPTTQPPRDYPYPPDDMPRSSTRPSRPLQPSYSAPSNQAFWFPQQDPSSSRRPKDAHRERGRDQDRERDKPPPELDRYKDRPRADRHRERERERDRPTTDTRYQDTSRPRHLDRRKDPDLDGPLDSEQRNAFKPSLSTKEPYTSTVRESSSGHRRHRTEDGTASTSRRHQPETTQNPVTTIPPHSTAVPQPDVQQTGEPPPAPRVMPVYLPSKAKSQRSHRDPRPSTAQGAQSGSDTERAVGKHRIERTPSGPAVQRSDAHTSRDRANHDLQMGSRDDVKRLEVKHDARQPHVDIPLVTPGFSSSVLPPEGKAQIVSIRAGQGPSDPHPKSSVISHSDAPQEVPRPSSSTLKSSSNTRSYPYETRVQPDRPLAAAEHSRTDPRAEDLPAGQRVSIHEPSRALPTPISKPSYSRGNPEPGVMDAASSSHPHSRPPSRSAHRTANHTVTPAMAGPRPLRSTSQGPQTNDPPTRPPSGTHHVSTTTANPLPSSGHLTNTSPPRTSHAQSSLQPSPKYAQLHGVSPSHSTSTQASIQPTPVVPPQTLTSASRPSTRDGTNMDLPHNRQQPTDQQRGIDNYPVKASWVVQTPATAKRTKISREDKYLRAQQLDLETPQAQLRQVLSQDDDSIRRASSSIMKSSQATTPTRLSQRNSPGTKATDVSFGTPRGMSAGNSPKAGSAREAPTPEHVSRQNLLPHLSGPPQISVVDATPVTSLHDLPHGRVDHALLAPPFPAPTRVSRTTSSSQNQSIPSQPAVRNPSPTSYHPKVVPPVHAPSLFQPYQPPSPPMPEDSGQFSPPPLPVPPPGGFDDSPPPPIETRLSEIIPTRSNTAGHTHGDDHSIPEVQSEMLHLSSQPLSQPLSMPPPRITITEPLESSSAAPTAASNEPVVAPHSDARSLQPVFSQFDDVPTVHQEIIKSTPIVPSQSSASTRSRPKVTIEDAPENSSPTLSKGNFTGATAPPSASMWRPAQSSQNAAIPNVSPSSRSAGMDPPSQKSSPPALRNRDSLLHRNIEPNGTPSAPPMPPPTPAPASRFPSSAPPTQPTFPLPSQVAPAQRVTSHAVPSRTTLRAAELLPTSKPSTSGSSSRLATAPVQATLGPAFGAADPHQPLNAVANAPGPWVSRHINIPTTSASHPSTPTASMAKSAAPISAYAPHMSGISQPTTTVDPPKYQSSRPGPASAPPLDTTFTTVTSTPTGKNTHSEQPVVDSTRSRDAASTTTRTIPSQAYLTPARAGPPSATIPQTHVAPAQSSTHHRTVSFPITSSTAQKPPSPRKYPQPIPSITVSTQPFPTHPPGTDSQSVWPSTSGGLTAPTPVRPGQLSSPNHTNDVDMLNTPSSIAPSPMLNPDSAAQPLAVPTRTRKESTDSKDDKKKGIFGGLFRTRTQSLKGPDPAPAPPAPRTSLDQGGTHPDATAVPSVSISAPRGVTSNPGPKDPPPVISTSTRTATQSKHTTRVPHQITIPPPPTQTGREHREPTTNLFTPFKFLHSKRNRTVSAASLDVCDGNTATNTVVGSPAHSTVSQVQPLPGVILPGVRDPLVAASEWRDREEADRRERRINRIRRPGVTFDVEEEPPSPAPGMSKRKKLVRRPSGRSPTPGPPRG